MTDGRGEWVPKPIVFPKETKADDWAPRPITFGPKKSVDDWVPKPVSFGPKEVAMTDTDKPRAIDFGGPKKQPEHVVVSEPKPIGFPPRHKPVQVSQIEPRPVSFSPTHSNSEQKLEQKTGRNIVTPEEAKFNLMVAKASAYDSSIASRPGFVKKLTELSKLNAREVINWGGRCLEINKEVTDRLASLTRDLTFQDAARWIDVTQTESTKMPKTGFFDRFAPKDNPPDFYEIKLSQIRDTLDRTIGPKIDQAIKEMSDIPDVFSMEVLALRVWIENLTDATAMQIADNRYRILIQAQQGILMTKQALDNMQVSVSQSIQQIDELVMTVIPKWKIAHASQTKGTK